VAVPGLSVRNPPGGRTTVLRVNMTRAQGSRAKPSGKREENRREPEGNAACGKALSDAEIATVERREARHPVARGAERLTSARVPVMARTAGCSRGTRAPPALRRPLRGRNDATRLRKMMRKG